MTNAAVNPMAKAHHHVLKLMGCKFVLTAIHENPQVAWDGIRAGVAEIERIENLISSWKADSQTSAINNAAGKDFVRVDRELFDIIKRSIKVSKLTNGAFDISGTLARFYWKFNKTESEIPSWETIKELQQRINFRHILLDKSRNAVMLKQEGMKIGFGAIGKGYAALRAKVVMENLGIQSGLVNASGDLLCWGAPPDRNDWEIKITNPEDPDHLLASLNFKQGAVVTSGSYESYALIDGKRYSHIIDPRTGMPCEGVQAVSVICPNPELADALATAVMVLGAEKGLILLNRLKGVEGVLVDNDGGILYTNNLSK